MRITEEQLYQCVPIAEENIMGKYPNDDELPKHKFSKRFERKMRYLIFGEKHSPEMRRMIMATKRIAIFLLICSVVTFSCFMTVEAFRAKVIEIVTEIFEDLTQFSFFSPEADANELGELTFTYLPEDLQEVYSEKDDDALSQSILFEDTEGRQLTVTQQSVGSETGYDIILDTEDSSTSETNIDGEEATLVTKGEWSAIMWNDEKFVWLVYGEFSPDELAKVSNGITIK